MSLKRFIHKISPPDFWRVPVIVLTAVFAGLLIYVIYISRAPSYLSDDPETCVNCHIMSPQFASWSHSAHREYTNCNSCHVPHDNIFNTYYFKAKDGLRHATIFTLRAEPQVIQIKEAGKEAVQQNCVRCHDHLLVGDELLRGYAKPHPDVRERKCWDCHRHVPHGRVNSLSSTPYARVPVPESPIPEWLENVMENEQ